jgi:hypothetical protein
VRAQLVEEPFGVAVATLVELCPARDGGELALSTSRVALQAENEEGDGESENQDAHGMNPALVKILPPVAGETLYIEILPDRRTMAAC